jgi:hypothetical protein
MFVALIGETVADVATDIQRLRPGECDWMDVNSFYADLLAKSLGQTFEEQDEVGVRAFRMTLDKICLRGGIIAVSQRVRKARHNGRSIVLTGLDEELDFPGLRALDVKTVRVVRSTGVSAYKSGEIIYGGDVLLRRLAVRLMISDLETSTV